MTRKQQAPPMPPADLVEDFDFMLSMGEHLERAIQRTGRAPRTIIRAYQRCNQPVPDGLGKLA